ncbi:MAG TPA: hypothetical protein VE046_03665 [Steroidobacteraceae bacterium]|nr:hypothetical protein [Steroidobacteraceae bacterium]
MKFFRYLAALLPLAVALAVAADPDSTPAPAGDVTFREPFTLKLHVDKEHYYEQHFERIPYVFKGGVYLFKGDRFGVTLDVNDGAVRAVAYQPKFETADVTFAFSQDVAADGTEMMLLIIRNHTKYRIAVDALMTVPDREAPLGTSILPIEPGLSGYESWPHPIVQLLLHDIRIDTG